MAYQSSSHRNNQQRVACNDLYTFVNRDMRLIPDTQLIPLTLLHIQPLRRQNNQIPPFRSTFWWAHVKSIFKTFWRKRCPSFPSAIRIYPNSKIKIFWRYCKSLPIWTRQPYQIRTIFGDFKAISAKKTWSLQFFVVPINS